MSIAQRNAVVGRSPTADVRLSDKMVSAFHFELTTCEQGVQLSDLHSTNGTFHGSVRVVTAVLASGTVLELGTTRLRIDVDAALPSSVTEATSFGELRGTATVMRELFETLAKLSRTDLSLLIEGATGSGKELAARAVHTVSARRSSPFVVLDCTALPGALAESILFGHEKGAFTGAIDARPGVFEQADGGTVFLDEIGELPIELQPKLLRVLERREVVRVGGRDVRPLRFRVVSATWRDLRAMINQGRFREDLYYRVAQARVAMPSLRERAEDIPLLVADMLRGRPADAVGARSIAPEALVELSRREFPGNVRELRSVIERSAAMAEGDVISAADLAFERMLVSDARRVEEVSDEAMEPFKEAKRSLIDDFERGYLKRLLERSGNKLSRAARMAQLERHTLRDLFRKHGLRDNDV